MKFRKLSKLNLLIVVSYSQIPLAVITNSPTFSLGLINSFLIRYSKLFSLLNRMEDNYLLIFSFNDCSSCIYRGIDELKTLKKAGKTCIAIVVHDYYEEIKSWSSNQDFSPFMVLKRIDFHEHIKTSSTPVLVKIRDRKIKNAFYIFAN